MKIYDIDSLKEGTEIIAQRAIPGPYNRYDKGTVFKYMHVVRKSSDGFATIMVEIGKERWETYDDYFRFNTSMNEHVVTLVHCVFDET